MSLRKISTHFRVTSALNSLEFHPTIQICRCPDTAKCGDHFGSWEHQNYIQAFGEASTGTTGTDLREDLAGPAEPTQIILENLPLECKKCFHSKKEWGANDPKKISFCELAPFSRKWMKMGCLLYKVAQESNAIVTSQPHKRMYTPAMNQHSHLPKSSKATFTPFLRTFGMADGVTRQVAFAAARCWRWRRPGKGSGASPRHPFCMSKTIQLWDKSNSSSMAPFQLSGSWDICRYAHFLSKKVQQKESATHTKIYKLPTRPLLKVRKNIPKLLRVNARHLLFIFQTCKAQSSGWTGFVEVSNMQLPWKSHDVSKRLAMEISKCITSCNKWFNSRAFMSWWPRPQDIKPFVTWCVWHGTFVSQEGAQLLKHQLRLAPESWLLACTLENMSWVFPGQIRHHLFTGSFPGKHVGFKMKCLGWGSRILNGSLVRCLIIGS